MNETPTSGPMTISITHHAREATSSRHSFSISQMNGVLRKGKEDLFERGRIRRRRRMGSNARGEFLHRPLAAHAPAAEKDEAIAYARGVGDLVDRQEERAADRGVRAERRRDLARLAQIEPDERLVG